MIIFEINLRHYAGTVAIKFALLGIFINVDAHIFHHFEDINVPFLNPVLVNALNIL